MSHFPCWANGDHLPVKTALAFAGYDAGRALQRKRHERDRNSQFYVGSSTNCVLICLSSFFAVLGEGRIQGGEGRIQGGEGWRRKDTERRESHEQ